MTRGSYSDGWRYLECAPSDQSTGIQWYNGTYMTISTGTAVGTGKANTAAIIAAQGSGSYAAELCGEYSLNGYSDWFLPSENELLQLYTNYFWVLNGSGSTYNQLWSSSQISSSVAWFEWGGGLGDDQSDTSSSLYVRAVREF